MEIHLLGAAYRIPWWISLAQAVVALGIIVTTIVALVILLRRQKPK